MFLCLFCRRGFHRVRDRISVAEDSQGCCWNLEVVESSSTPNLAEALHARSIIHRLHERGGRSSVPRNDETYCWGKFWWLWIFNAWHSDIQQIFHGEKRAFWVMVSPYPFGICTPLYVHLDLWPFVLCTVHRLLVAKNDELKNPFACGTRSGWWDVKNCWWFRNHLGCRKDCQLKVVQDILINSRIAKCTLHCNFLMVLLQWGGLCVCNLKPINQSCSHPKPLKNSCLPEKYFGIKGISQNWASRRGYPYHPPTGVLDLWI